jgi:predicted dehydrogenase
LSSNKINRRNFIKKSAVMGASTAFLSSRAFSLSKKGSNLRLGIIGTGLRGQWISSLCLIRRDVDIKAICDIDPAMINSTLNIIKKAGGKPPDVYKNGEHDFLNLLQRDDLDAVYIATPWRWHHPMAVEAMKQGMHVGVECPAALKVSELWDLVNTSERTDKHCMLMENVCYRRDIMAVLNMVRKGLFGELLHCQGGYQHDLRDVKFNNGRQPYGGGVEFSNNGYSESKWRTQHSIDRNGDLYPTHGVGPISTMLNINRGNRFLHMTSTSSQPRGLHKHIVDQAGRDHQNADINFKLGDIITSVIKCSNGQTIVLSHDTSSPRPYSLNFRVQGTEGLWMVDNNSIYIQGLSKEEHQWDSDLEYLKKYDHPVWKKHEKKAAGSGHGGMDFFILNAFIEPLKKGLAPPIDVYDAASMSVISPLSEKSIKLGSAPVKFPDFTRGKWKTNQPIFGINENY